MYVTSSDEDIDKSNGGKVLAIEAKMFPIGSPSADNTGVVASNIPPTDGMSVAQRGNIHGREGRTSCIFIDAKKGQWYMLDNVTTPNLYKENYSVLHGKMPSDLYALVHDSFNYVSENDPVVYGKYGIFQNFLQLDPNILIEQAAGITNGQQVYDFIMAGSEAAGAASGIMNAKDPLAMIDEMIAATRRAADDLAKMKEGK